MHLLTTNPYVLRLIEGTVVLRYARSLLGFFCGFCEFSSYRLTAFPQFILVSIHIFHLARLGYYLSVLISLMLCTTKDIHLRITLVVEMYNHLHSCTQHILPDMLKYIKNNPNQMTQLCPLKGKNYILCSYMF